MGKFSALSRKRKIEAASWGLAGKLSDLALINLALAVHSRRSSLEVHRIFNQFEEQELLTGEKIKKVFYRLKQRGLIDYARTSLLEPEITEQGQKRLKAILPVYNAVRTWDKHLYLVTYDVPQNKNVSRDRLRRLLKTIGCGLLQKSVWLTPYNPKEILEGFVYKNNLIGLVLVSDLGKGGSVGEEDNRGLVSRVYKLEELNQRYQKFLDRWKDKPLDSETQSHFYSILKDDPQLPFELLPDGWLGEKAWERIKELIIL